MSEVGRSFSEERMQFRRDELDFERSKLDHDLRKWCVEQVASRNDVPAGDIIMQASKLYEWVRWRQKPMGPMEELLNNVETSR